MLGLEAPHAETVFGDRVPFLIRRFFLEHITFMCGVVVWSLLVVAPLTEGLGRSGIPSRGVVK